MDLTTFTCVLGMLWYFVIGAGSLRQSACRKIYKYKKQTADCQDLNLKEIPDSLSDDIEILVASDNRIRELKNETLAPYPSLQYLYLTNNFVHYIEPGAFTSVPQLEVLDLSVNGVRTVPQDLPLPLRKLYLNGNRNLEPITLSKAYNLQFLSLAECHLSQMPNVGQLPNLLELNLTGNPITTMSARNLAPFCRLQILHTPEGLFQNNRESCSCHEFQYWITKYGISTTAPINCTDIGEVERELCLSNRSKMFEIRQECLSLKPPFNFTSTTVLSSLGCGLLIIVLIILCCLWRRSRRKRNTVQDNRVKKSADGPQPPSKWQSVVQQEAHPQVHSIGSKNSTIV